MDYHVSVGGRRRANRYCVKDTPGGTWQGHWLDLPEELK
jgi:hypothetical protein